MGFAVVGEYVGLADVGDAVGLVVDAIVGIIEIVGSAVFVGSSVADVVGLIEGLAEGNDVGYSVLVGEYVGPVGAGVGILTLVGVVGVVGSVGVVGVLKVGVPMVGVPMVGVLNVGIVGVVTVVGEPGVVDGGSPCSLLLTFSSANLSFSFS